MDHGNLGQATNRVIEKSSGQNSTERFLTTLADRTFLKLWSYANPHNENGKEICDLIAVFENHVFLFFVRESKTLERDDSDILVQWQRWEKEVIQKQISSAKGAESYIRKQKGKIYLDAKRTQELPIKIQIQDLKFHKFIIAHGAGEACKAFSEANVRGSLGIWYGEKEKRAHPFIVQLDKSDIVHVLDSENLEIVFNELDTFADFISYIDAKEDAIKRYDSVVYCGEEDLLAHYFFNFDEEKNAHVIGTNDEGINCIMIGEGEWQSFSSSSAYRRKKEADRDSYLWDDLIQRASENAFSGRLRNARDIFNEPSAIREMAKEPRFSRRALTKLMRQAIEEAPNDASKSFRQLSVLPSFYEDRRYVFLQLLVNEAKDYEEYCAIRREMVTIACGVVKNQWPHLKEVIGIGLEPPKISRVVSEDLILMNCENWSDKERDHYNQANEVIGFLKSPNLKPRIFRARNFPQANERQPRIGQNQKCPCGSGRKYKNCHGR